MKRARIVINVEEYRILYDNSEHPASNASCAMQNGTLWMTMQLATDGELGVVMRLTKSHDRGRTWSVPRLFGPPLGDEKSEFQSAQLMALPDG